MTDYTWLSDLMEFDHVIEVHADGSVTNAPNIRELWAPELMNDELPDNCGWSLMGGYTGQEGGGDTMHDSEFIGGNMARDILATPGYYVAIVGYWLSDDDETDEVVLEGWAVAYRESV
jgi:hypothetical protein